MNHIETASGQPTTSFKVGRVLETSHNISVELSARDMAEHMAIFGGTGKGKSKFVELLIRQMIDQHAGVCIIDPHGDLVEDLLAFVLEHYRDATDQLIASRFHYFDPGSPGRRFSFDPFRFTPRADGLDDYEDWLKAKVESVARIIIRKQGEADFAGKPRLERFLSNVLYAVGVRLNDRGDHLSLADAFVLLDPAHVHHDEVYRLVEPRLPPEVRADFRKVKACGPRQQEDWVESTINRLRSFLSPVVKSIFANNACDTIDFGRMLADGGILLVNLRRTRSFTTDQANALGGLFINEIIAAAQTADRSQRRPFYLIIDEASRFIGQDLIDALAQCRKWKLSLCMAVQDLSSLRQGEIDMIPKVLSQCGAHVSFQQKHPDDLDLLGQLFGYAMLDFEPLLHEVDRHDGYELHFFEDESFSSSFGTAEQDTVGEARNTSQSRVVSRSSEGSDQKGESRSNSQTSSTNRSDARSVNKRTVPLSKYRTEMQETGRLRRSVSEQIDEIKSGLRRLGQGQALISIANYQPVLLQVRTVHPAFRTLSEDRRLQLVDGYKGFLTRDRSYCFSSQDAKSDEERLAAFISRLANQQPSTGFRGTKIPDPFGA